MRSSNTILLVTKDFNMTTTSDILYYATLWAIIYGSIARVIYIIGGV